MMVMIIMIINCGGYGDDNDYDHGDDYDDENVMLLGNCVEDTKYRVHAVSILCYDDVRSNILVDLWISTT